jgi:Protein of unknown function (DUF1236)
MKRTLLVSVAAIALAIGANTAYSQGSRQGGQGGAGNPSATAPGGSESAPGGTGSMSSEPKQKGAQEQTTPRGSTTQREEKGGREPGKQQSQGTTGSGTTKSGAAERKNGAPESKGAETKSGSSGTKGGTAETKSGTSGAKSGTAENKGGSNSGNVSLSTEQKTQIRQSVLTSSAPRVSSVNFDVHVGTVVPRSVHIVEVPATLVTIEPRWRGYKYFVYRDEIVIIEPDTLRIVAVLVV